MRTSHAWVLLVLGFGCVVASVEEASAQGSSPKVEPASTVDSVDDAGHIIRRGIEVYREQLCGICHRFDRVGTKGSFGPSHDGFREIAAERLRSTAYTGAASSPAEYIRESIVKPKAFVVPGYAAGFHQMPPYIDLTSEDLEALIQLLLLEE